MTVRVTWKTDTLNLNITPG